jgi:predicted nucleic acid-binding protein
MICLDTNVVIVALNQPLSPLRARLNRALVGDVPVTISSIVLFELWYGVARANAARITQRNLDFLAGPIRS